MREAFRVWLKDQSFTVATVATQWTQATHCEERYGDLDAAYDVDRLVSIQSTLDYSKEDERSGRPDPSKFGIIGNVYADLAGYRGTLTYYGRFRQSETAGTERPGANLDFEALDRLKRSFLATYPDFSSLGFQSGHGAYWVDERDYKEKVLERTSVLLADTALTDEARGQGMMALLQQPPANFVGWRTFARIRDAGALAEKGVATAIGEMLSDPDDAATVAAACAAKIHPLMTGGLGAHSAFGAVRSLVTIALAMARPDDAFAVKTRYLQRVVKMLTGQSPFKSGVMTSGEYREVLSLAKAIFALMRDKWGWAPKDLWDVQGFLWATSNQKTEDAAAEEDEVVPLSSEVATAPTNLILYGPPGTGKTYATATRAVVLCDGSVPAGGRDAVMARYADLVARKRISFVTFHQSYAYEDFVEGLRPEAAGAEAGDTSTTGGFSLRPHAGIFRRIAELARDNRGQAIAMPALRDGCQAFKMSLGRSAQEEGTRIFREAIEGGYVLLGWGGEIDWSAPQYAEFDAIKARWREDHPEARGSDPNIQQLYTLRSWMKVGDLVIVSDGNKKFRAIGEITGPYSFVVGDQNEFYHRRPVRWLWHNDDGRPRELIYSRGFSQVSTYKLDSTQVKWPALEQIIAGGGEGVKTVGLPEAYVLIIDEINRANVSKVFGELITLIEPDKRLGAENALTVTLPYSGDTFGVPSNLHIIGTMNTADRSIALLDTALRRRFDFEELMPDPSALTLASMATGVDLIMVLTGLNGRIEYLFDREHQIGHAFFIGCRTLDDLAGVMRNKVIPLLAEYFYENWEKVRQVLGEATDTGTFVGRRKLDPPKGVDTYQADDGRWRYIVHTGFPITAYEQLKP